MSSLSILYLTQVRHIRDYMLEITFSDGSVREADLAPEFLREVGHEVAPA